MNGLTRKRNAIAVNENHWQIIRHSSFKEIRELFLNECKKCIFFFQNKQAKTIEIVLIQWWAVNGCLTLISRHVINVDQNIRNAKIINMNGIRDNSPSPLYFRFYWFESVIQFIPDSLDDLFSNK